MNQKGNRNFDPNDDLSEIHDKITRFGAVLIAVAIILFCYSYTKVERSLLQAVLFGLGGLLAALGLFIIVVIAAGTRIEKNKTNFFLYDKKAKKNILPSELTVAQVRQRITHYMSAFKRKGKLYVGELFELSVIPECIKPLFCYELLCQIAEDGNPKAELFLSYGIECAELFAKYLSQNGDYDLARAIKSYTIDFSGKQESSDAFATFLSEQKRALEEKMLSYTLENIDKF